MNIADYKQERKATHTAEAAVEAAFARPRAAGEAR